MHTWRAGTCMLCWRCVSLPYHIAISLQHSLLNITTTRTGTTNNNIITFTLDDAITPMINTNHAAVVTYALLIPFAPIADKRNWA